MEDNGQREFSKEEIENFRAKREADFNERIRLAEKVKKYTERINQNNFDITIYWETDLNKMDLNVLSTPIANEIKSKFPSNFSLTYLDLDWMVEKNCSNHDEIYPKNDLWAERSPNSMARLIETVEKKVKIIPPLIQPIIYNRISIRDGHHRVALCRYLKLKKIPFLIENVHLDLLKSLN